MSHVIVDIEIPCYTLVFEAGSDSTDMEPGTRYVSGETLEEYGIDNLSGDEARMLLRKLAIL